MIWCDKKKRIYNLILIAFFIMWSNTLTLKTISRARLGTKSRDDYASGGDDSDEIGGTLWDGLDSEGDFEKIPEKKEYVNPFPEEVVDLKNTIPINDLQQENNWKDLINAKDELEKQKDAQEEQQQPKQEPKPVQEQPKQEPEQEPVPEPEQQPEPEPEQQPEPEPEPEQQPEPQPEPEPQPKQQEQKPIVYGPTNETANPNISFKTTSTSLNIMHTPFSTEHFKNNLWAILVLIIFGTIYLILRAGYNYLKNISKFYSKCVATLSNQIMFLIICDIIILLFYTYGTLDSIPINWQFLISGFSFFLIAWFSFGSSIIIFSFFTINSWSKIESKCPSFAEIRHQYDVVANIQYDRSQQVKFNSGSAKELIENFEFLVLKRFFFIPLFPIFKACSLQKEMKFSVYLKACLIEKIKKLFKFTWTCWIVMITFIMIWNVYIASNSILMITVFNMIFPLFTVLIALVLLMYCKYIYRKVVDNITQTNMSNYQDVEFNPNSAEKSLVYPKYIFDLIQNDKEMMEFGKNKITLTEHLHTRPASLYENQILFGSTGFVLILNILQTCALWFVSWIIILFTKHYTYIKNAYSHYALFFIIPILVVFFLIQAFVTALVLKWFTIIDSIEMKRNKKCIKKLTSFHWQNAGIISEKIFQNFKKILFDMKLEKQVNWYDNEDNFLMNQEKENELKLSYRNLQDMIRVSFAQYTHSEKDDISIDIKTDLIPFWKTTGNHWNGKEIEFMWYFIENFNGFKGKINVDNLFDIYGAQLYFRSVKPIKIIHEVFSAFYKKHPNFARGDKVTYGSIEMFLNAYHNFFSQEEVQFFKEQCSYWGDSMSLDSLMMTILSFRQYYPC